MYTASGAIYVLGSRMGANQQAAWSRLWENFMMLQLVSSLPCTRQQLCQLLSCLLTCRLAVHSLQIGLHASVCVLC